MSTTHVATSETGSAEATPTVWILVLALSVGGAERTIVELVNGMDGDRFDIEVWTVFDANPLAESLDDDVTLRTLGVTATRGEEPYEITGAANPLEYLSAPLSFVAAVRRERPAVLHSFLFYDNVVARFAGVVSPGTTVVTGERGFHNASRPLSQAVDRATMGLSDVIVSNSRAGAEYYAAHGFDREDLRVIRNGRDLSAYRDGVGDGIRAEFGVSADAPVVGTVGRLVERKGHDELLHAFARVTDSVSDAQLLVVGHGPERSSLEATARELGIEGQVHFTGGREDVPALLDAMDLFAFPSYWEGLPGALQEAMAAGLPTVATRVDGTDELVTHGETGLLVPAKDPAPLADAIERLLTDTEAARALGERAQTEAFTEYTRERMVAEFQSLYADLTDAAASRAGWSA